MAIRSVPFERKMARSPSSPRKMSILASVLRVMWTMQCIHLLVRKAAATGLPIIVTNPQILRTLATVVLALTRG